MNKEIKIVEMCIDSEQFTLYIKTVFKKINSPINHNELFSSSKEAIKC